jgi:hypothetical protein
VKYPRGKVLDGTVSLFFLGALLQSAITPPLVAAIALSFWVAQVYRVEIGASAKIAFVRSFISCFWRPFILPFT